MCVIYYGFTEINCEQQHVDGEMAPMKILNVLNVNRFNLVLNKVLNKEEGETL